MSNIIPFSNEDFYISFRETRLPTVKFLDDLIGILDSNRTPQDKPETALCILGDGGVTRFLILYGDHRDEYLKLVPDLKRCIGYFKENIHLMGHSSDSVVDLS